MAQVPSKQVGSSANIVLTNVACASSVAVGDWVRMSGGVAVRALGDVIGNSNVIGLCESKSTSVLCNVRVQGVSLAVFAGLDETKDYFLSSTVLGGQATTPPTSSGNIRLPLGQPFSTTRMLVHKGERTVRA